MEKIFVVFAGVLGAVVGSFLSVLVERLPRGEEILRRRSHCLGCARVLAASELIPLASFLWQRGRCRHCRARIPWRYPILEATTAGAFMAAAVSCPLGRTCFWNLPVVLWWFFLAALIVIAAIDYFFLLIPVKILSAGLVVSLAARVLFAPDTLVMALLGMAVGGGFLGAIVWISGERWMGSGDAELGVFVGALVGFPAIGLALLFASLAGGLWGSALLIARRKRFGDQVPFAPFLVLGTVGTIFLWSHLPALLLL